MKILVLNGSPRPNGDTAGMVEIFQNAAEDNGHLIKVFNVCRMNIKGCIACEYCHRNGNGKCAQKDDMQEIYDELKDAEMLVLAAPIYYHGISGQLKCAIDRFYSVLYPSAPATLKKIAMFLSSGADNMYDGARFIYEGEFIKHRHLEGCGIFTNHDSNVMDNIREMAKRL